MQKKKSSSEEWATEWVFLELAEFCLATAKLLMAVNEEIDCTVERITNLVCKISNAEINGSYHCLRDQ